MLKVIYCEYDATHKGDFVFDLPNGQPTWLMLMTQTPAIFDVDNKLVEYPANVIVLYKPHQKTFYKAIGERYSNDWVSFETDELFIQNSPILPGIPFHYEDNNYVHKIFQLLVMEQTAKGRSQEDNQLKLMEILFGKLADHFHLPELHDSYSIFDLQKEIQESPAKPWTVQYMAEKLHISTSHLEKLYKENFGVTCMQDVIDNRIRLAKEYLINTAYNISEIAQACGYASQEHFFRQFKKIANYTPLNYRKKYSKKH